MSKIGSVTTARGRKALLLGSGELGKEVAIELQRMGVEVVACDKYAGAPAMQVAHRCYVFNMLDGAELRRVIELEKPDHIIPEVRAIATPVLVELEKETTVTPTATAAFDRGTVKAYAVWPPNSSDCPRRPTASPRPMMNSVRP